MPATKRRLPHGNGGPTRARKAPSRIEARVTRSRRQGDQPTEADRTPHPDNGAEGQPACKRTLPRELRFLLEEHNAPPLDPATLDAIGIPYSSHRRKGRGLKGRSDCRELLRLRDHNRPACPFRVLQREYLVTGPSTYVPGQTGVYAAKDIPKGTRLGRYLGVELTLQQLEASKRRFDRVLYVNGRHVDGRNILSLINSPRGTGMQASCRFLSSGMVVSKVMIREGEELLVGYGTQYWNYKHKDKDKEGHNKGTEDKAIEGKEEKEGGVTEDKATDGKEDRAAEGKGGEEGKEGGAQQPTGSGRITRRKRGQGAH